MTYKFPTSTAPDLAKIQRMFAPIHTPRPWWFPSFTTEDAPAGDIPLYTHTESSVGGASATYSAMVGIPPTAWSSSNITKYGYLPGARTFATVPCYPNVANGHVGVANFLPKYMSSPYFIGFNFDGAVLRWGEMIQLSNNRIPYKVWVDGKYAGEFRPTSNGTGATQRYHTLTWGAAKLGGRRIVMQIPYYTLATTFGSPDNNASISPMPKLPFKCVVLGDSWVEGVGVPDAVDSLTVNGNLYALPFLISLKTGWEVFSNGQGGTKPDSTPGADEDVTSTTTPYNSPYRIRAVAEANPHLILIEGTSNADSTYNTTLSGGLDDLYTKLKAACPNAFILHVGPQPPGGTPSAGRLANRDMTATRAAAAGIPFVDPIAEAWINGSGTWGTPVNGGNSSLYYGGSAGADGAHMRNYAYYADRVIEAAYRQISLVA